jgi:hypothetical protein
MKAGYAFHGSASIFDGRSPLELPIELGEALSGDRFGKEKMGTFTVMEQSL